MNKTGHVLVVDDDEWLAEQHVRTLSAAGFSASISAHAVEAINSIEMRSPDVIVLDLFLAGPNAFVLLHELQSHSDLASIPVILCTNSDLLTEEDVADYGVCCVLYKSQMTPSDLVAAVRKALA